MDDWRDLTSWQALEAAARSQPSKELLVVDDERWTYGDIHARAAGLAAALHARGIGRGDVVALWLLNGVEWLVTFFAAARLGAITVSLNTRLREREIAELLVRSGARALVVSHRPGGIHFVETAYALLPELRAGEALPAARFPDLRLVLCTDEAPRPGMLVWPALARLGAAPAPPDEPSPDDVALIQYTSGSTGEPKGAMLTHAGLLRNARLYGDRMGVEADDRYFCGNPLFHVAGVVVGVLNALTHRSTLVTMRHYEAGAALALLERERCTARNGLDTMFQRELGHPDYPRRRLVLRKGTMMGAGAVLVRAAREMGMRDIISQYSLSEASCNAASTTPADPLEVRASTVGRPLPGVELRLVAPESGRDVAAGEAGEVLLRGWNVMKGYYRAPERTSEVLDADGWLHTGDLGRLDAAGNLVFVGRLKDIVRVGGENVAAAEVESFLLTHPAVKMAQVVPAPDADLGEVPVAFIELHEAARCTAADLLAHCQGRLARFKTPRAFEFVAEWPTTGSGKIHKPSLRERARALPR